MEVLLAESAGFCFGVRRAVEKVYGQIGSGRDIYTYGPIIHNEEVVKDLCWGDPVRRGDKRPGAGMCGNTFPRRTQENLWAD